MKESSKKLDVARNHREIVLDVAKREESQNIGQDRPAEDFLQAQLGGSDKGLDRKRNASCATNSGPLMTTEFRLRVSACRNDFCDADPLQQLIKATMLDEIDIVWATMCP
ncbi:hypothetical protein NDA16_001781 [Ustilago loliicola]|nr:hypothetical protein NDA16_001781 [Ustilago loliicola]